jgi:5,10-methylenetetrahydromethanopterin reductase
MTEPQPQPVAIYLQDAHPIRDGMEFSRYAEEKGFAAVWQAESRLVRESTVPMAAFAPVTDRIKVGSGVADIWSRNPARLAATFSTLDDLAPGRVILGLGARGSARRQSRDRPGASARSDARGGHRRASAAEQRDGHDARRHVHLDGSSSTTYQERRAKDVPIYIGATGMKMMELTGEIADGVVLNYLVSPDYNARAMEHLQIGLDRSGARWTISTGRSLSCSVHEDRATALDMARMMVTQYLGQQPHIMKASGVPQSLLDAVGEVLTWPATNEQVAAASKLVPDEIVQMLTASGTPAEASARADYIAGGCTCPILYPLGDVTAMIDTFSGWTL